MTQPQQAALVERIVRIVRDRGDIELFMQLDRIMDKETEPEMAACLGTVVKALSASKQKPN